MSIYVYDLIKIKYIREGYLSDLPYHLISDNEMYDAFLTYDRDSDTYDGYFTVIYPAPEDDILRARYDTLIQAIYRHLCIARGLANHSLLEYGSEAPIDITDSYLVSSGMIEPINVDKPVSKSNYVFLGLPNWIYTYMLGNTISENADDDMDYQDLLTTFKTNSNNDLLYDCYTVSVGWIQKLPDSLITYGKDRLRPPTIFGEPHVIKAIRLEEASRSIS